MIRRWFVAGLLFWLPVGVTVLVLRFLIQLLDASIALLPPGWRPDVWFGQPIPGFGVVFSLLLIVATGALVANFAGRRLVAIGEALVRRIPLVRSLYSGAKQAAEAILSDSGSAFRRVLLVEYPRKGMWTLGFQTGTPSGEVQRRTEREVVSVFIPTTPNPTSGFIVMVPREDVVEMDMAVEDALRMIISLGMAGGDGTRARSGASATPEAQPR